MKYDLVCLNMSSLSEWEGGYENRNRHVVEQLAADPRIGKILLVDYPPYNPKRLVRSYLDRFLTPARGQVLRRDATSRLVKVTDSTILTHGDLYQLSTIDAGLSDRLFMHRLQTVIRELDFHHVIVWSYLPFFSRLGGMLGEEFFVFDTVDNWLEHPSYRQYRDRLKQGYQQIGRTADVVFGVNDSLSHLFERPVIAVPNGVDFQRISQVHGHVPADIAPLPDPVIIYVGIIEHRFDSSLMLSVAEQLPRMSFVALGPVWDTVNINRLRTLPNVHFLGRKVYELIPAYLREASVGIVPHVQSAFTESMDPMKVYQYLAAGLPVVSTPNPTIDRFGDLVTVTDGGAAFAQAITQAVTADTPTARKKRQTAMADHDWSRVVKGMLDTVLSVQRSAG